MRFTTDPLELERGLFAAHQSRFGAQTSLNINFVPDLLQHVKQQLAPLELIRLEDYHLQNYLMELSVHYAEQRSLTAIVGTVLAHIRGNNHFWYRHNNQEQIDEEQQLKQHAIVRYQQDMDRLRQLFADVPDRRPFTPSYTPKTTRSFSFHQLHSRHEPHFGTRQPLNHIAYIPAFLASRDNGQQREIMQECIVFLMSNKSETVRGAKEERKENSQEGEEEKSESEGEGEQEQEQQASVEQERTVLDQFLEYVQKQTSLPKFPNSHHMHVLTYNLINACLRVQRPHSLPTPSLPSPTSSLKTITLNPQFQECLSLLAERYLVQSQLQLVAMHFLQLWQGQLRGVVGAMRRKQRQSVGRQGWLNSEEQIARVKQCYQQMLDNPDFVQLTRYRALGTAIPWKEEDYLRFLRGLNEYLNIPTNNKKIACFMGEGFQPNHVKHVKGVYLAVMKERMERGECGGGKRGKSLSKCDFIDKDISNFSLRWFEKAKKIKKRKPKRRRRNSDSEDCEEEPDSQY